MLLRFPLKLSCGHFTRRSIDDPGCTCAAPTRKYESNGDSPVDKALEQFNGRWRDVLENYGARLPSGHKHGACPCCGGKDRFRFDDKNGRGTWYCSQCPEESGGGLKLLSMLIGKSTMETAKELVGDDDYKTTAPKRVFVQKDEDAIRKANIEQAKKGAVLLMQSSVMSDHQYMANKGFSGQWPTNGQPIFSNNGIIKANQLLLVPFYKNDELINVQKITVDGTKRPLWGGDMSGVQHVIDGKTNSLAIVEGYATGVTVNMLTGYKTYCGYNTGNLAAAVKKAKADHPTAKIVIFADHDKLDETHNRRPGEYFANEAAAPFGAIVALPPDLGDWDDYRQAHGDDKCKVAMREAIKKDMGVVVAKPAEKQEEKPVVVAQVEAPTPTPTPEPTPAPKLGGFFGKGPSNASKPKKPLGLKALPEGVCLDSVDLDNPPSIAGDIVDYIRDGAHRVLEGGAYSVMSMQILAMAAAGIEGYDGNSMNLITITLGVSAAGKERPQRVAKKLLKPNGMTLYGDIRSDKDLIRVLVDGAKCFYLKDEAHSILGQVADKDQNKAGIASMLLEIATSDDITLSALHISEFQDKILTRISRLEKMKIAKEDIKLGYNVEREDAKIKVINKEIADFDAKIEDSKRKYDQIGNGIENPRLSLSGYSTPTELSGIINERTIGNGFLGRTIIVDCGEERSQLNPKLTNVSESFKHEMDVRYKQLLARVGAVHQMASDTSKKRVEEEFNGRVFEITATKEAKALFTLIRIHYDDHLYINHQRLGALYSRLLSRVTSLASILAVDNLVDGNLQIEEEYVLFALKITLASIEYLHSNLRVNEAVDGVTVEDKLEGIKEAIIKRLSVSKTDSKDGWRYISELKNYLKRQNYYREIAKELLSHGQDAMVNAISVLRMEGRVEIVDKKIKKIR